MFCSICGDNINLNEALICRVCGLLYCQFCGKHEQSESSNEDVEESEKNNIEFRTENYKCRCQNGDIQLLEDLRGYLIQDFLRAKNEIQSIANNPVQIFQKFLEIREKLINLGSTFILMPDDFSFQKDILSTFSMAEQFALEHLHDLRSNIRNLYDQLLIKKEQFIEPEELRQINLRLSLLSGKIEKFKLGFDTYFGPLEEDASTFNEKLVDYFDIYKILSKYKNLAQILDTEERIFFISGPMWSNLGGITSRHVQIMITNHRIVFFRQPIIKFKKNVKILKIITGYEVTGFETKNRKFRSSSFVIRKDKENIELSGSAEDNKKLERFLQLIVESIQVPVPKLWKHWQIGKIWSSDSYYSNIDKLLRWELRPGLSSTKNNFSFNGSQIDFNKAESDIEYQTDIVDYLSKQTEKITQRIRVQEYLINDLKARKNTMSINEFYSLYENFTMKLKDLEGERNSLLGHYSRGSSNSKSAVYV